MCHLPLKTAPTAVGVDLPRIDTVLDVVGVRQRLRPVVIPDFPTFFQFGIDISVTERNTVYADILEQRVHVVGYEETEIGGRFFHIPGKFIEFFIDFGRRFVINIAVIQRIFGHRLHPMLVDLTGKVCRKFAGSFGKQIGAENLDLGTSPATGVTEHPYNGQRKISYSVFFVHIFDLGIEIAPVGDGQRIAFDFVLGYRRHNTLTARYTVIFQDHTHIFGNFLHAPLILVRFFSCAGMSVKKRADRGGIRQFKIAHFQCQRQFAKNFISAFQFKIAPVSPRCGTFGGKQPHKKDGVFVGRGISDLFVGKRVSDLALKGGIVGVVQFGIADDAVTLQIFADSAVFALKIADLQAQIFQLFFGEHCQLERFHFVGGAL